MTFDEAAAVFVHGFAYARSLTHPYLVERLGETAWRLHDAPRRSGDARNEELVAFAIQPAEADSLARQQMTRRFKLCQLCELAEDVAAIRSEYKRLGYRLLAVEPFFIHRFERIDRAVQPLQVAQVARRSGLPGGDGKCRADQSLPVVRVARRSGLPDGDGKCRVDPPLRVVRVETVEQATALAKAAGRRQIRLEDLEREPPAMRQYVALDGDVPAGWVASIPVCGAAWCSNLFV